MADNNTHKGKFGALVYLDDMQFPVEVEVAYTDEEAQSVIKAHQEHCGDDDWVDIYDIAPSLAMSLRQAFIEACPDDFQFNAEGVEFDYLTFPEELTK